MTDEAPKQEADFIEDTPNPTEFIHEVRHYYRGEEHVTEYVPIHGEPPPGWFRFKGHAKLAVRGRQGMGQANIEFGIEANDVVEAFANMKDALAKRMPEIKQMVNSQLAPKPQIYRAGQLPPTPGGNGRSGLKLST